MSEKLSTPQWVDTHCHLQLDERDSRELLERADNVAWIVAPGIDLKSSQASLDLAAASDGRVLATAGLHPHHAEQWPEQEDEIVRLAEHASAVGETGLDYYRNLAPPEAQLASFSAQIDVAKTLDLPLIVHCRDAFADVHRLLEDSALADRAILHCWTGGRRWTRRFLDLGVNFSFAGPLAFETGETIRLAAELVPPSRALVETDTPYLAPPPHRGKPNEPAWVGLVGGALANVWGMSLGETSAVTSANASRVFRR